MLTFQSSRALLFTGAVCCLFGIAMPLCVMAQQSPAPGSPSTPAVVANLPANLATITTDTGAMAPGDRDFSRYTRPEFCFAAMARVQDASHRTLAAQTYLDTLSGTRQDTLGLAELRAVGRACSARLSAASLAAHPSYLWTVALLMHDDSLAQATYRRALAETADPKAKATLQLAALNELLSGNSTLAASAENTRVDTLSTTAQVVLADIDRTAPAPARLQAHSTLLGYALQRENLSAVNRAAEELLTLLRQAPARDRDMWERTYRALMTVAYSASPDSMAVIAAMAQHDSVQIRGENAAHLSTIQVMDALSPIGPAWDPHRRDPFPQLTAEAWLPAGDHPVVPMRGKVTLLVSTAALLNNNFSEPIARKIRRWLSQYGAQGFTVTIVEAMDDTAPYWYHSGNDWVLGPLTATQRVQQDGWFYREYAQLPVTIAVQEWRDRFGVWPNNQRERVDGTPFEKLLRAIGGGEVGPDDGTAVLIDRQGKIVMQGILIGGSNYWWDSMIQRIVTETTK